MIEKYEKIDKEILGNVFTSTEVYDNLLTLTDFGSRFGGTKSEKQAVEFMLNKFSSYDLDNVQKEEFEYQGWIRGDTALEIVKPISSPVICIALPYCPSTASEGVEGELISAGNGSPEEYERIKDKIPGKFVLVTSKEPTHSRWRSFHRTEKLGMAIHYGAEAVIFQNHNPGRLENTGCARCNQIAEVPSIAISYEEGWRLKRLLTEGLVIVRITANHQTPRLKSWNVFGDITGQKLKDDIIVVGAHFDGHDIALGAMDDGSGASVVMETARLLVPYKKTFKRTLRFICFPLEEIGLTGAYAYTHKLHTSELNNTKFMLNLDGAGRAGESPAILTEGCPEIVSAFKKLAATMKYDLPLGSRLGSHSDFFPFFLKGVPSASLVSSRPRGIEGRGFSHTSADTPDKVKLRPLREAAMVVSRFIYRVADLDSIPAKRKSPEEVKKLIKLYGLEENIIVSKKRTVDQLINEGIFATPLEQKEGYLNTLFKVQSV
ncbi:MAG: M28 family peptidase [Candidatus Bathyarchaeota archaeon]|nr:MAG: M28 family peptidase [Candidatus Bathyarchaeota archaeon]